MAAGFDRDGPVFLLRLLQGLLHAGFSGAEGDVIRAKENAGVVDLAGRGVARVGVGEEEDVFGLARGGRGRGCGRRRRVCRRAGAEEGLGEKGGTGRGHARAEKGSARLRHGAGDWLE